MEAFRPEDVAHELPVRTAPKPAASEVGDPPGEAFGFASSIGDETGLPPIVMVILSSCGKVMVMHHV